MTGVADKLREARALIERGWCQGEFARNERGNKVTAGSPNATSFCAVGAIVRVKETDVVSAVCSAETGTLRRGVGNPQNGLAHWNDAPGRTQAEVLAAFDRAIELAEKSA